MPSCLHPPLPSGVQRNTTLGRPSPDAQLKYDFGYDGIQRELPAQHAATLSTLGFVRRITAERLPRGGRNHGRSSQPMAAEDHFQQ